MGKGLVIVESPAKATTIAKVLGSKFDVIASYGHIKDLPKSSLGVNIEADFEPLYETIPGKTKALSNIRKLAASADQIFIATDPDREGEAIAWHIAEVIGCFDKKKPREARRIEIHEITKKGIQEGLNNPREIDKKRYESQQARRILDRLVGYQISPILWEKVKRGLSAGRVQSVAVRLIVDREAEIAAFVNTEYWNIRVNLEAKEAPRFWADLFTVDGERTDVKNEKGRIKNEDEAKKLLEISKNHPFIVKSVTRKENKRRTQPPFTTSKLQQDASRQLRFSSQKTMSTAQKLFEGIDLGAAGTVGLITYMRTDSVRVSADAVNECRQLIANLYGNEYLPTKANNFASGKNAQDAHEAIRPTDVSLQPDAIKKFLNADQYKLYKLIWNRFVASQMREAVFDTTTIDIQNGPLIFRANGSIQKFKGYQIVYEEGKDDDDTQTPANTGDVRLPRVEKNDSCKCHKTTHTQHFTQPPPRYNEATLIKELETCGIGRPSTYSSIVSLIQNRDYVERQGKQFHPTELGQLVTQLLVENFPSILNIKFTAKMEANLDEIAQGAQEWVEVLNNFYGPFKKDLKRAGAEMRNVKRETEETDIICEKCGETFSAKWGKNGYFLACNGYPKCKNTKEFKRDESGKIIPVERVVQECGTCPKCSKPMIIKTGRYGRFLACSSYPECKHTQALSLGIACPKEDCDGELFEKRSKKGRVFYGCGNYPKCKYATWNKPTEQRCPNCQAANLEEVSKRDESKLLCPNCAYSKDTA
ncbi:MAG: type I DNA topoisomerase [Bradymonadia bacterium]|jgi:DNA topoisomerase-1